MLKDYLEEKVYLKQQNRFYRMFLFFMVLALIISTLVTYYAIKQEKVVLVPPSLSRTVEISGNKPSSSYLEEMVGYIFYLALNYVPETIDWQMENLLELFDSDTYSTYKQVFSRYAEDVKATGTSSSFVVTNIKVYPERRKIVVNGILNQWTRDRKFLTNDQRSYVIEYSFKYGRFYLKEFKECKGTTCEV